MYTSSYASILSSRSFCLISQKDKQKIQSLLKSQIPSSGNMSVQHCCTLVLSRIM
uniref:Uncharacterized protein n=1 Tax=Anguilla anguilla TaxID=7936 RepID=A0A0E9W9E9_ANGAN